jgi:sugar/nucleoside kinase (ribokinase family)
VPNSPARRHPRRPLRIIVLGDLVLDVVLAPAERLATGTDVPGRVALCQGGSAANTARWLGRLGVRTVLVASVGRDAPGRALVAAVRADRVVARVRRVPGGRTGRVGVFVAADGERSFVADRGAADALAPTDLRAAWFRGADLIHLPAYSLIGEPLGTAAREAIRLARAVGALVSVDLASVGPLLRGGREAAMALIARSAPDLLFATTTELDALVGPDGSWADRALELAPVVVVKRGPQGATLLLRADGPAAALRFDVPTRPLTVADSTGAGDAFDAGFLAEWLASRADGRAAGEALRRGVLAGHRTAARQVSVPRPELRLG